MNRFFTLLLLSGTLIYAHAILPRNGFPTGTAGSRANGNSSLATQPAAPLAGGLHPLNDTLPPVLNCPPSDTVTLASGSCDTVYTFVVTVFDSLETVTPLQVLGLAPGDTFPLGTTINSFLAVDSSGNSAACSFSVTVQPATNALICRDTIQAFLGPECWVSPDVAAALMPPWGCPESFKLESDQIAPFGNGPWVPAFFDAADRGKTYQLRVTDQHNGTHCWTMVRIADTLAPILECPEINVPCALPSAHLTPAYLKDTLGIAAGMPVLFENCPGNTTLTFVNAEQNLPCDSPGTVTARLTRFWTAVDVSNNVATCVQAINRHRALADVSLPADVTVSCAGGNTEPPVTGGPFVQVGTQRYDLLTAPLCEISAVYTDSAETLACDGASRIYRRWTVADLCRPDSMPLTGVQLIDVTDTQGPSFRCTPDTMISIGATACKGALDLPDVVVGDSCSYITRVAAYWTIDGVADSLVAALTGFAGSDSLLSDTLAVFDTIANFPTGLTSILYVASDACGNSASCELTLRVLDSLPPLAVCDSMRTAYLDQQGITSIPASLLDDGSSDACSSVFFKIRRAEPGMCDTLDLLPNDLMTLCCADVSDTVMLILRVYELPVPPGRVPDNLAAGHFSECTVPVVVRDDNPPHCEAPDTVSVECESFDVSLAAYGAPHYSCNVDSAAVQLNYSAFDTLCRQGTIVRTFQVFDTLGQMGQCTQQIQVQNVQNYFIRFPDDGVITMCDTAGNYGVPEFFGVGCEKMAVDLLEEVVEIVPDACFHIVRNWTIRNWCTYDPNKPLVTVPNPKPNAVSNHPDNLPGPVVSAPGAAGDWAPSVVKINPTDPIATNFSVFWTADANGYQYKQVIKVIDLEEPAVENCPADMLIFVDSSTNDFLLWNANYSTASGNPDQDLCEGQAALSISVTDACSGSEVGVDFILFLDLDDDGTQETAISSSDLPAPGTLRFNNANTPNYGGGILKQFDHRTIAQNDKYQFALTTSTVGRRKVAQVVWHTPNAPANNKLPQLPLGTHRIEWVVYDNCGNESTCAYFFQIEDPDGTCSPMQVTVGGAIETESDAGIANVAVALDGTHPNLPTISLFDLTDASGNFDFSLPVNAAYTVTPLRDDNHLNGVSTFDLLLINKHVLGLEKLSSPYKIIAADANRSNSVTTFDIVELRKLILGLYQQLPNNTSWRFVPKYYLFSDPANPFLNGFPELDLVSNLQPPNLPTHDFIGIKVGDVNGNAALGLVNQEPDDRGGAVFYFDLADRNVAAGELFAVTIQAAEMVSGFQFTLDFPGLELADLLPGAGLTGDNFAVYNAENALAASVDAAGKAAFTLRFRAISNGRLSSMLRLSDRITRSEAYDNDLETMRVALRFDGLPAKQPGFELYQNRPNPFTGATEIGFYLPAAQTVRLNVFDASGRVLFNQTREYGAGFQSAVFDEAALGGFSGLLYYQIETDAGRAQRKMLRL